MENKLTEKINIAFERVYHHGDLVCSRHDHNQVDIRVFHTLILAIINGADIDSISKLHDIKGNLTVYFKETERLLKPSYIEDAKHFNDDLLKSIMAFKKAWEQVGEEQNQVYFSNFTTDDSNLF